MEEPLWVWGLLESSFSPKPRSAQERTACRGLTACSPAAARHPAGTRAAASQATEAPALTSDLHNSSDGNNGGFSLWRGQGDAEMHGV